MARKVERETGVLGTGTDPAIVRAVWAGTWMALTFLYLPAAIAFGTPSYAVSRVRILPLILGAGPVVVWFVPVSIVLLRGTAPNGQKAVPSAAA